MQSNVNILRAELGSLTAGGVGGVHVTEYQSCYNQSLSSCENLNRQFESGGSQ